MQIYNYNYSYQLVGDQAYDTLNENSGPAGFAEIGAGDGTLIRDFALEGQGVELVELTTFLNIDHGTLDLLEAGYYGFTYNGYPIFAITSGGPTQLYLFTDESLTPFTTITPIQESVYNLPSITPPAPSTPDLTPASDSGASNSDNLTSDTTPTFTGTADPDITVELFADGFFLGSTTTDGSGYWSFTVPESAALPNGTIAITAIATDPADPGVLLTTPIPPASPGRTTQEFRNDSAFAALKSDGSVVTWGEPSYGGDSSSPNETVQYETNDGSYTGTTWYATTDVSSQLSSNVSQIFSTGSAFAALKTDGSVVTWGGDLSGGNSSAPNGTIYAAITDVSSQLSSGVTQIYSSNKAFAALKTDGSVVTWGAEGYGGDSSSVSSQLSSDVTQIYSTLYAFAALKTDGSVVTWGGNNYGGDKSFETFNGWTIDVTEDLRSNVTQVFSTETAFAALKTDGSVVTWGSDGGNSIYVSDDLQSGVSQIFSTDSAFAALKTDGSVVTWGDSGDGGYSDSVSDDLQSGVSQIFSTIGAFAAVKDDGSVVTWGKPAWGGDSSSVSNDLQSGVNQIFATSEAFAALKSDGSVITWGDSAYGGNSSSVADQLQDGVTEIFSTFGAFAAVKDDGSVVLWGLSGAGGEADYGGITGVPAQLQSGVTQIFSTGYAFAALKSDGSVVTWGNTNYGGDSSSVSDDLQSDVVTFADPFQDDRLIIDTSGSGLSSDPSPVLTITVDTTEPAFTSGDTAAAIDEHSGAGQGIYTASTTDSSPVTYSLKPGHNDDAASFSIESTSGEVTLDLDPDYESQSSYNFTVVATDSAGNTSEQAVTLPIIESPAESYELPETTYDIGGTKFSDTLNGTNEADYIFGKKGDDILDGLEGDDLIRGGGGRDTLKGSEGNDYLNGSKGRDILFGGIGADVFKNSKGLDVVKDFSIQQGDKIALPRSGSYEIIEDAEGVLIKTHSKRGILLEGLEHSEVMAVGIDLFVQPV